MADVTSRSEPSRSAAEIVAIVGAPLALAIVECFHPQPRDLLQLDVPTWLAVHYAQIALFPLSALAIALLVRAEHDIAALVCRGAMFVFAVSYVAFDTAAGVATGELVKAARASGAPEAWRPAIDAIWSNSIVGASDVAMLAVLGAIALSVGGVAAAIALKRAGASWPPLVLLALSGFGLSVFKSHAVPGGPVTFGGIAIAALWVVLERRRRADQSVA
jgi:hypothetical protein